MGTRNREGRELEELVMRNGPTVAGTFDHSDGNKESRGSRARRIGYEERADRGRIIRMGTRNQEGRELVELVMRNGLTVAGSFGWEQGIERVESWKNWL